MGAPRVPRDQPPPPVPPPLPEAVRAARIPPPVAARFKPAPLPAGIGSALARAWNALGWRGKLLVGCGAFAWVVLVVLAVAGLSRKPGDEARNLDVFNAASGKTSGDSLDAASATPKGAAATPAGNSADTQLDCDRLAIGDTGTLTCAYVEIVKIIGDQTCIVLPYEFVQWSDFNSYTGLPSHIWYDYRPKLPILLKGWLTSGKVTGQKVDLDKTRFCVIGTDDVKNKDGGVIRVHVLELVK